MNPSFTRTTFFLPHVSGSISALGSDAKCQFQGLCAAEDVRAIDTAPGNRPFSQNIRKKLSASENSMPSLQKEKAYMFNLQVLATTADSMTPVEQTHYESSSWRYKAEYL